MRILNDLIQELESYSQGREKASSSARFFKTGPGEYGEGDFFLGITVPVQRKISKKYYRDLPPEELVEMIHSPYHEHRLTGIFILVLKFEKSKKEEEKQKYVDIYLKNTDYINNWDLVDSSAYKILGPWLANRDRGILYDFAKINHLWKQRIAIISTYHFIRNHEFDDTLEISEILLHHSHDLIQKAVGWMLREVGNRDLDTEITFLGKHYKSMPRTMLRYAIGKFEEPLRKQFLTGTF